MANIYDNRRIWKTVFLAVSLVLVAFFLHISNNLVDDLADQERERMEIWANATKALTSAQSSDIDFYLSIIKNNNNIPVLLVDDNHIPIKIDGATTQHIYYEDSTLLTSMSYLPRIQIAVMIIFVIIVYLAVMSTKKAEQNKVWVGLSKETAHQLGTPISSLMAWVQMLEASGVDKEIVEDMDKDVNRLSMIADRFSKIGSKPEMKLEPVCESVRQGLDYMRARISTSVALSVNLPDDDRNVMLCRPLFAWVIENLCKNAVDAMQGKGSLNVTAGYDHRTAFIEVTDTGKGIARKNFKTVFSPGFTTKKRGWGLGLTLAKRIIEEYHGGRIFVKWSEIGAGTTFRIELPIK